MPPLDRSIDLSMNTFSGIGHLGADPNHVVFSKGVKATFRAGFRDGTDTVWLDCQVWNGNGNYKIADWVKERLRKGSQVGVAGRIAQRSYEKNGVKFTVTYVKVDSLDFLDKRDTSSTGGSYTNGASESVDELPEETGAYEGSASSDAGEADPEHDFQTVQAVEHEAVPAGSHG